MMVMRRPRERGRWFSHPEPHSLIQPRIKSRISNCKLAVSKTGRNFLVVIDGHKVFHIAHKKALSG